MGPCAALWTLTSILVELGIAAWPEDAPILGITVAALGSVFISLHVLLLHSALRMRV
jgi:hypothetical protein